MGLGGFFKGVGKGLAKVGKVAAPIAATAFGGPLAGMAVNKGIQALSNRGQQPGRGIQPSGNIFQQRFPQMTQAAMQGGMGGGGMQMGGGGMGMARPQMNLDDWISAGRNTVNPEWMLPAFNPNQPHPLSRMPPYGNAPMRPRTQY